MQKKYIVQIVILFGILLSSCETTEKIDDFPLRPSRLVVNSYFAADSAWQIQVSKSLSVLDNADLAFVRNAKINIYKDDQLLDSIVKMGAENWYTLDRNTPVEGAKYSIEVKTPDFSKAATAEDFVPVSVPISDVSVFIRDSTFYRDMYYGPDGELYEKVRGNVEATFTVTIDDPSGVDNYYQLQAYTIDVWTDYQDSTIVYTERRPIGFSTDDPAIESNEEYNSTLYFSDEVFDGQRYKLKLDFEDWDVYFEKEYIIELKSMNKAGYLYRRSVKEYMKSSGDPFSEPVLIYGNIKNGYGIFAGYSVENYKVHLFD